MPYDITTKDGITLRNIPDDVAPDSPQLKARVEKIRSGNFKPVSGNPDQPVQQDVSLSDRLANFGRGAQAAITAPLVGINQRIGGRNAQNISDAWREDMAQTGKQPGGLGGQLMGGVMSAAPLAMLPGANTVVGGGLYGLLQGASMPTAEGESAAGNMAIGAAAGSAIPVGIRAAKTMRAVAVDPFTEAGRGRMAGNVLKRAAGDDAAAVAQRLATARGNTPGFTPSVAQAAGNDGISAFERTMRAIDPQSFQALNQEQKGALIAALSSIAKTPEERAIAVQLRDQAVKPLYDAAKQAKVTGDAAFDSLMTRPTMQSAASQAAKLAAERNAKFALSKNQPAQTVPTGLLDAQGNPITTTTQAIPATYPGQAMHDLKMGLDDAIGTPGIGGLQGAERNAALDTKAEFLKWLESKIPQYGAARQTYADMSRPINQMDIGQELYNRFVPAIADQGGIPFRTGADAFSRALLRNGDQLARNVTGMKGATLNGIMEPEQLALLQGVSKDAGSIAASMQAGRGAGSDTVQKIAMSNIAQEAGIPTWVSNFASVPGGWAKRVGDLLYGNADDQVRMKLSYLMTHPQEAAQAMNSAGATPSRLGDLLKRGGQFGAMSIPPALQALAAE